MVLQSVRAVGCIDRCIDLCKGNRTACIREGFCGRLPSRGGLHAVALQSMILRLTCAGGRLKASPRLGFGVLPFPSQLQSKHAMDISLISDGHSISTSTAIRKVFLRTVAGSRTIQSDHSPR